MKDYNKVRSTLGYKEYYEINVFKVINFSYCYCYSYQRL